MPSIHLAAIACAALCALAARSERSDTMLDLDDVNLLGRKDPDHFAKTHEHAKKVHEALDTLKEHTEAAKQAAKTVHEELRGYQGELHTLKQVLSNVKSESINYETAVVAHLKENEKNRLKAFAKLPFEKETVFEDKSPNRVPEHRVTGEVHSFMQLGDEGLLLSDVFLGTNTDPGGAGAVVPSKPDSPLFDASNKEAVRFGNQLHELGDGVTKVTEKGDALQKELEQYKEHLKQLKMTLVKLKAENTAYGEKVVEFFTYKEAERTRQLLKIQEELDKLEKHGRTHVDKSIEQHEREWAKDPETKNTHMETSSTGTVSSGPKVRESEVNEAKAKVKEKSSKVALLERGATAAAQQVSAKVTAHGALHQAQRHTQSR